MKRIVKTIVQLLGIFTKKEKKDFTWLQFYLIIAGGFQLVSIGLIFPMMELLLNPEENIPGWWIKVVSFFQVDDKERLYLLGIAIMLVFTISTGFVLFTRKKMIDLGHLFGANVSSRLYRRYLKRDYLFHISNNSSALVSNIVQETERVVHHVVTPLLVINQQLVFILFISAYLVYEYTMIVFLMFALVGSVYLISYNFIKHIISANGERLTYLNRERITLLNEGFNGIKDVKLYGNDENFINSFESASSQRARSVSVTTFLSVFPRFILEWLMFISAVVGLFYLYGKGHDLNNIIPHVSVLAVAAIKLLPSFQQIFSSITSIRNCELSFRNVSEELKKTNEYEEQLGEEIYSHCNTHDVLKLSNIEFSYPNSKTKILNNISLKIDKGSIVAFVGATGSGKTTLVNMISGLISPTQGEVLYGSRSIYENVKNWQKNISYVSQDIYLSDRSISENVAFGVRIEDIDFNKVKKSLERADILSFAMNLPDKLQTIVGERGVQLSGGQRQRVAIARALYFDSKIIIFDEGTSALDTVTEQKIIDSLLRVKDKRTVIMVAHRLSTVRNCDEIFVMKNGEIVESGKYMSLLERGGELKAMSQLDE